MPSALLCIKHGVQPRVLSFCTVSNMITQSKVNKIKKHAVEASPIFLHRLYLRNFLSFGPDMMELALRPLNLIIGANGSGKSNLIEAISLLRSSPVSLGTTLRLGGGASEWI